MRVFSFVAPAFILVLALSCSSATPEPISEAEEVRLREDLSDRSFRQFEPSRDAEQRKGVILEFFNGITLWAQYAEGEYAEQEWEISSEDFRILSSGGSEYELLFVEPTSWQRIPSECENCIDVSGVSVSVRGLDGDEVSFKINDPEGNLPIPFPVFNSWTTFQEDEYFE